MMDLGFEGSHVLVTGASTGIGRATAELFSQQGARVAIHYGRSKRAAESLAQQLTGDGRECDIYQADLSVVGGGSDLAERVLKDFSHIDVLVNNAGGGARSAIAESSDEAFETMTNLNYRSVFETCRAIVPSMQGRGSGSIVNVSSISARTGGAGGSVLYSAAKASVATFTRGLAKELAPRGIRVNAISPGYIDTPFHQGRTDPELLRAFIANIPLGRGGQPEDCAWPILFLASDRVSTFVTGQVIEVNGGQISP